MPTIHSRVSAAADLLRRAGISDDEAPLDARLLAQYVLGWDAVRYLADARKADSPAFSARFDALVERRARREPLAYIVGEREFWNLTFEVTPAVLVPRPETELLVETALEQFPNASAPLVAADVCTGSGCVAVAFAFERPHARVLATDVSDAALDVARRNAARHGVADRVHFARADLLQAVGSSAPADSERFDLVVSNPPYVPEDDAPTLAPEVKDFEPAEALFAGPDGLAAIRRLIDQAGATLRPGGVFICEFGFGQADAVCALIATARGLTLRAVRKDLQGIDRVVVAAAN